MYENPGRGRAQPPAVSTVERDNLVIRGSSGEAGETMNCAMALTTKLPQKFGKTKTIFKLKQIV